MDFGDSPEEAAFRQRLREWLAHNNPGLPASSTADAYWDGQEAWHRSLYDAGFFGLSWPKEVGGHGLPSVYDVILDEELAEAGAPPRPSLGYLVHGILRHGNVDVRRRFLPGLISGRERWCQGFSEPEAGSDLPALRTRATRVDGGWLINGQKVWTSYAGMAQWCFLLARVGTAADRRDGITVFLVDMAQPGIEVRPISSMLGPHHLNEVYFDDVWVPDSEVLGEVGHGWTIVTEVLRFERIGIARYARCEKLLRAAPAALGDAWDRLPASLRERWALALVHTRQARLLAYRVLAHAENGSPEPLAAALYRIAVTTLDQEVAEVLMEIVGNRGLGTNDMQVENDRLVEFVREVEDHWRYAQASTVASGTLEMNKQVVARAVLS